MFHKIESNKQSQLLKDKVECEDSSEFLSATTVEEQELDNPMFKGKKMHIYFTEMIEGECFGQTSLFDDSQARFCIVSTLKPTHVLCIDNLAFRAMNRVYKARMEADCF
jgi:CRP-like cAMP-binding protein